MRDETPESTDPLRTGFTTGACATACALAAARLLLCGESTEVVTITLPKGQQPEFSLHACEAQGDRAYAATIKDAGDDPDVTHGALIQVWLELIAAGIEFAAGPGVGTVTRAGLPISVGEPAINPVPRKMISEHLQDLAAASGYSGGFRITIGVENGAELAKKTMNPRLGIVDGLSILGTTGIVRPFSCSAYIASIHQGMDVAKTNGISHIAVCTGNSSEMTAKRLYGLPEMAMIEMGDFAGAVLKYLKKTPFQKVTLVGGIGKFAKLAAGHLDLHSRVSQVDFAFLRQQAAELGASEAIQQAIAQANTAAQVAEIFPPINNKICELCAQFAGRYVGNGTTLEVVVVDRTGLPIGQAVKS